MYRGEDYPDMSEYLVHFTKGPQPPAPSDPNGAYRNMLSILYQRHLKPSARCFGSAKNYEWLGDMRRAVCFSEVPLPYVSRIAKRYSLYGIGFAQTFVAANLGARVWYLDVGSAHDDVWLALMSEKQQQRNPGDAFWGMATCVDRVGIHPNGSRYQFEWEREWRIPGPKGLQFQPDDVAFLFLPEAFHSQARQFFRDAVANNTGPGYFCPYIDPLWAPDRIEAVLAAPTP